jgi:excisionase family DNA binding protein
MRLEEWQKWLDAQFLDEEENAAGSVSELPNDSAGGQSAVHGAQTAVLERAQTPSVEEPTAQVELRAEARIESTVESFSVSTPAVSHARDTDEVAAETVVPSTRVAERAPLESAATDLDMPVPAIEQYLPFLKSKRAASGTASATTSSGKAEQPSELNIDAAGLAENRTSGIERAQYMPGSTPEEVEPPAPARRIGPPNHRSKRGQRRGADQAAPPMTPDEVWSLVPRHFKALVAMSGNEIAQHSYKRAFKESRIDLIQRLLDPTISLEETARLLNVCPTTVRRYTNRGVLRHQRTVGDQRRFKLSDVLAFLESQSQVSPPSDR